MPKYNVLATINEFFEVEADSADDAESVAFERYRTGKLVIDACPIFVCDECDLLENEDEE